MRVFWPFITGAEQRWAACVVRALSASRHRAATHGALGRGAEDARDGQPGGRASLEEEEEQMLHRVFGFSDLTAGQVMVPRTEMVALRLRRIASSISPTRWPAAATRGCRSIARASTTSWACCNVTDLFQHGGGREAASTDLTGVVRDAFTVPETMQAGDLLSEMRTAPYAVAIVIDEFGGTAGLVTFAGLMERIVGEVGPGGARTRITVLADGSALIDGLALVADVNAQFGLQIDEEAYTRSAATFSDDSAGGRASAIVSTSRSRTLRVEALDGLRVARIFLSKEKRHRAERANESQ